MSFGIDLRKVGFVRVDACPNGKKGAGGGF